MTDSAWPVMSIAEAHARLTEIHRWFTEGFDTADLRDAGTLLHELEKA